MTFHVITAYFSTVIFFFFNYRKIFQCTFNCYDTGHDLVPLNHTLWSVKHHTGHFWNENY